MCEWRMVRWVPVAAAAVAVLSASCVGFAKERYTATVSYVLAPLRPLPAGLEAVAVLDAGVTTAGARQDERERKWATIAADMIEAMLANGGQWGAKLTVAKRGETQRILAEQDLRLAGLVEGEAAARAGKLLAVQGLITSRVTIDIDLQRSRKSAIDWLSLMGGVVGEFVGPGRSSVPSARREPRINRPIPYLRDPRSTYSRDPRGLPYSPDPRYRRGRVPADVPGNVPIVPTGPMPPAPMSPAPGPAVPPQAHGGLTLRTKEIEEISRLLTVQCSFGLIDAMTGQAILSYATPPCRKKDTASPHFLFGGNMDESDLDPVDHFIGELIEQAAQEFVAMMVPVRVTYSYEVVGRGKAGEAGVRALRADDDEAALSHFDAALRKEPHEHETVFVLGVTHERLGRPERALECYRRAAAMKGVDEDELARYLAAKDRLTRHLHRILPSTAAPGPSGPTTESAPAGSEPTGR